MKVIISGGGTGGHVFPAIAIADAIKRQSPQADILFVGAEGKLEMEKVPKAGYPIKGLWISGFQRSLSLRNFIFPFKVIHSMWRARQIVRSFRPDVAVGVGGYASGPLLRAAAAAGIPTLIQEQNGYAGVTNKLLSQRAKRICVAYEGMERYFPAEKIVFTGNPVRNDIYQISKRDEGIAYFGLDPSKPVIAILGGSLGARTLNRAIAESAQRIAEKGVQILWQCGRLYEAEYGQSEAAKLPNVQLRPFIDRMDLAYSVADVVIARAGALTISELCLVGKPSVLVPSPNVAEDHQTKNAQALVNKGAAVLIRDADAIEQMMTTAFSILDDAEKSAALRKNMLALGRPTAADDIAKEVIRLAVK